LFGPGRATLLSCFGRPVVVTCFSLYSLHLQGRLREVFSERVVRPYCGEVVGGVPGGLLTW
jgi:hypothetical protein